MTIAFYSTLPFERNSFEPYTGHHQITYIEQPLNAETAELAAGHQAVCAFVNDDLSRPVLTRLFQLGVGVIGMRCVGLDNVDRAAVEDLGMTLVHVPGYSPYAVAEQAVALLLALVRHLPEAQARVHTGNYSIDGLTGFDLHGKTVGVIGTGLIGKAFLQIMRGFGCKLLAYDIRPDWRLLEQGIRYVSLSELLRESDVISLHCPLTPLTEYLIDDQSLQGIKPSAVLVNCGRGKLVNTEDVLNALDAGTLAGYAADVYENEWAYFHYDFSTKTISDPLLKRLSNHPKVVLTAHQGFLTDEALGQIARSLMNQLSFYENRQVTPLSKASMC